MQRPTARLALASFIAVASLLAPASAGATAPAGPNGNLAFTSGRAPNTDAAAKIWVVGPSGGTAGQVTSVAGQHRQPNWSPDHTKLAYAVVSGANTEIRVLDMSANTDTQFVAPAAGQDRPTWSPDGTQIAYGVGGKIFVKPYPSGSAVQVTNGTSDERPVWSPDGNSLYFNHLVAAGNNDIIRLSPVALAGTQTAMVTDATNDWQVQVSPDGSKLCYLKDGPNKDNNADLWTASALNANTDKAEFANDPGGLGSLNCVWSPDGTKIAYTEGAFSQGQLVYKELGESAATNPHVISDVGGVFDGNADWAVNFRPQCESTSFDVGKNGFKTIPLSCTDRDNDADNLSRDIVTPPAHGNLGGIDNNANTVVYTPNANFIGTDTFTFNATDGNSDSAPATITVNVGGSGNGSTGAAIDQVTLSRHTWRRGSGLPALLSRAPVGTTISYRLSEDARATLTFARKTRGRKVGRSCRRATRKNRTRRRCSRYVNAGRLQLDSKAGVNRVRFQGRLSRGKRLALGRYRLIVGAKDSAGNVSKNARPVFFKIVKR
jgi:hypothetical protein